jgi:uncharacterized protein YaiL (DUF2058 family)
MASLQDQLLKAGLVNKNKANRAKKETRKKARVARNSGASMVNEATAAARTQQAKRIERDRELNIKKQQELDRKAVIAQIKQLIEMNRLDTGNGEIAYSFVYQNKVKKVQLGQELKHRLSRGQLAIVTILINGVRKFEIVPAPVAAKIAQRDMSYLVQLNDKVGQGENEDDDYAAYKIPDDLMW